MIFDVIQKKKDLFTADFEYNYQDWKIGESHMAGGLGSRDGKWDITFMNRHIGMDSQPLNARAESVFRPYSVFGEDIGAGSIYQSFAKSEGVFGSKYYFHMLNIDGESYTAYPIGFGKEGYKTPVYCGDQQIALVTKDYIVYDDLHHFKVYAASEKAAFVAVLFISYMYVNAYYKAGQKVHTSVSKAVTISTNKDLKKKYNPEFEKRIAK